MRWTDEQARAIGARGGSLLLSAAAGSGKTTVLVERVLRLILDDGADIDRMLVVTFTRAAASDMRAKLSERLNEMAASGSARCREQLIRLDRASITTLHAFCADFLRTHFEAADVDPAFRILDDPVSRQLMDEALDETLEEAYAAPSEALLALDYGRGPKGVRALAEALCRAMGERADPQAWLARALDPEQPAEAAWMAELAGEARRDLDAALVTLEEAAQVCGCPQNYIDAVGADIDRLEEIRAISDYGELAGAMAGFRAARAASRKRSPEDEEAVEAVKKLRTRAADLCRKSRIVDYPAAQSLADAAAQRPQLCELGRLATAASARFEEKKRERAGLTYADLERRTLDALRDDGVARAAQEAFDYVFVDEYQDTSDIQEAIISRVARADNRFMVGDVKQSIYRFRMAEPRLFIEKYDRFRAGCGGTLLPLTRNFRSCPAVLNFVNAVFERAMNGGDSEIAYDDLARLNPGDPGAEPGEPVEIHLLERAARRGDRRPARRRARGTVHRPQDPRDDGGAARPALSRFRHPHAAEVVGLFADAAAAARRGRACLCRRRRGLLRRARGGAGAGDAAARRQPARRRRPDRRAALAGGGARRRGAGADPHRRAPRALRRRRVEVRLRRDPRRALPTSRNPRRTPPQGELEARGKTLLAGASRRRCRRARSRSG